MCDECAKKVLEILNEMDKNGEFDSEIDKQMMGMMIRRDMKCPQ